MDTTDQPQVLVADVVGARGGRRGDSSEESMTAIFPLVLIAFGIAWFFFLSRARRLFKRR